MCLSLLEMALLLLLPLLLAITLMICQKLPKDHWICIGRTWGDEETLVKSSNDRKLALYIGCTPNAKEYLVVFPSFLYYARHWHMHTHVYNHLQESHTSVKPGWTRFNPHQNVGWLQPRFKNTCGLWYHNCLCLSHANGNSQDWSPSNQLLVVFYYCPSSHNSMANIIHVSVCVSFLSSGALLSGASCLNVSSHTFSMNVQSDLW